MESPKRDGIEDHIKVEEPYLNHPYLKIRVLSSYFIAGWHMVLAVVNWKLDLEAIARVLEWLWRVGARSTPRWR